VAPTVCPTVMSDNLDDESDFAPEAATKAREQAAFEGELQRQLAQVPPELYEALRPLLLVASVATTN
jgi:hypothetical protein